MTKGVPLAQARQQGMRALWKKVLGKRTATERLPEWVVLDLHNTLQFQDTIDIQSLKRLKNEGLKIWAISYGRKKRNQDTQATLQPFLDDGLIDQLSFASSKAGRRGKGQLVDEKWRVGAIFDDSPEVRNECTSLGMEVYRVGWQPGERNLAEAVEGFLDDHAPNF